MGSHSATWPLVRVLFRSIALCLYKGAVHQQVGFVQQGLYPRAGQVQQLLIGIACVHHHVFARAVHQPGQVGQGLWLAKGFAPAKGDTL